MPLSIRRVGTWLAAVIVATAAHAPAGTIRHDRDGAAYTTLGIDPAFDSVGLLEVSVFEEGQPAVGSATLIAPDWVLTAAHVVEGGKAINFIVGGQTYVASRWTSHPKYTGNLIAGFDLALIQLSASVTDVLPAQIYRKKKERNSLATFVGFGRTGDGLIGDTSDDRLKRAGTNVIDGQLKRDNKGFLKVLEKLSSTARTFAVDFDSPINPFESRIGSDVPSDLEYLIARGDSGGGTFVDDPNDLSGPLLAGIHSFGEIFDERDDSDYGDLTGHTRVSTYKGFIDKTITKPGFQSKLNFITPTVSIPIAMSNPSARSIPATPIPDPSAVALATLAGLFSLGRRRRRR